MNSIYKIIDYIAKVSKQPITVDGKVILEKPVTQVTISDKFFFKDDCTMCGRCCPNENTAYTVSRWKKIIDTSIEEFWKFDLEYSDALLLFTHAEKKLFNVNGKDVLIYSHPKDNSKDCNRVDYPDRPNLERCHWLFEKDGKYLCEIHPIRSITCGMPHLRFFHNKNTGHTSLGVSQFGRNWALGCPVHFEGFDEESVQTRIYWLKELKEAADDLGIKTYLPEIIEYLESGKRRQHTFIQLGIRRKLF